MNSYSSSRQYVKHYQDSLNHHQLECIQHHMSTWRSLQCLSSSEHIHQYVVHTHPHLESNTKLMNSYSSSRQYVKHYQDSLNHHQLECIQHHMSTWRSLQCLSSSEHIHQYPVHTHPHLESNTKLMNSYSSSRQYVKHYQDSLNHHQLECIQHHMSTWRSLQCLSSSEHIHQYPVHTHPHLESNTKLMNSYPSSRQYVKHYQDSLNHHQLECIQHHMSTWRSLQCLSSSEHIHQYSIHTHPHLESNTKLMNSYSSSRQYVKHYQDSLNYHQLECIQHHMSMWRSHLCLNSSEHIHQYPVHTHPHLESCTHKVRILMKS